MARDADRNAFVGWTTSTRAPDGALFHLSVGSVNGIHPASRVKNDCLLIDCLVVAGLSQLSHEL